jgi:hypothetical protein
MARNRKTKSDLIIALSQRDGEYALLYRLYQEASAELEALRQRHNQAADNVYNLAQFRTAAAHETYSPAFAAEFAKRFDHLKVWSIHQEGSEQDQAPERQIIRRVRMLSPEPFGFLKGEAGKW